MTVLTEQSPTKSLSALEQTILRRIEQKSCSNAEKLSYLHLLDILFWRKDPKNFIFSKVLFTKDEYDKKRHRKPFPDKPHCRYIIDTIHKNDYIFIPKSRQMHVTWVCLAYMLWTALFFPYKLCFVQSKNEDDSAMLVYEQMMTTGRISFMYHYLPDWFKEIVTVRASKAKLTFASQYEWLGNGSIIHAVPQGPDVVRQYTISLFYSTECCFQDQFEDAYRAIIATAGKIVADSSFSPGFFDEVVGEVIGGKLTDSMK